jgi:L-alanine-DL-glutamate epimerase-like enolase superfamily enzyme
MTWRKLGVRCAVAVKEFSVTKGFRPDDPELPISEDPCFGHIKRCHVKCEEALGCAIGFSPADRAKHNSPRMNGLRSSSTFARMPLRISFAPYRLLFRHPFATSHGVRDGTDSIFIRLEEDGITGYGEVTLPPYLAEKPAHVVEKLRAVVDLRLSDSQALATALDDVHLFGNEAAGCRAGLHTAFLDLLGNRTKVLASKLIKVDSIKESITLVTLGITPENELKAKLLELPRSGALKLKVQDGSSVDIIKRIKELDDRPLFLDANQGLKNVDEALKLVEATGARLLALEQPFPVDAHLSQRALQQQVDVTVFGDESLRNVLDLELANGEFKGLNVKLMKCGGLDRAKVMADRAMELDMKVMLGSMSESSLGCTAMAHLAGHADLLDLDGPWLIKNDPFTGVTMKEGKMVMPDKPGIGVTLRSELDFHPLCA